VLTSFDGQATTGVVAVARSKAPRGPMAHALPRTQFVVTTTAPYPALGDPLSSPPV